MNEAIPKTLKNYIFGVLLVREIPRFEMVMIRKIFLDFTKKQSEKCFSFQEPTILVMNKATT